MTPPDVRADIEPPQPVIMQAAEAPPPLATDNLPAAPAIPPAEAKQKRKKKSKPKRPQPEISVDDDEVITDEDLIPQPESDIDEVPELHGEDVEDISPAAYREAIEDEATVRGDGWIFMNGEYRCMHEGCDKTSATERGIKVHIALTHKKKKK